MTCGWRQRGENLPLTDENLGAVMLQLRQSGGPVAIARLCEQRIEKNSKASCVLIDGIRNMNEFLEFKKLGSAVLVSIHASPERRFKFLKSRGRSDSPASFESFEARDRRELSVGIGEAIALADEVVINSGSVDELMRIACELLSKIEEQMGEPSRIPLHRLHKLQTTSETTGRGSSRTSTLPRKRR